MIFETSITGPQPCYCSPPLPGLRVGPGRCVPIPQHQHGKSLLADGTLPRGRGDWIVPSRAPLRRRPSFRCQPEKSRNIFPTLGLLPQEEATDSALALPRFRRAAAPGRVRLLACSPSVSRLAPGSLSVFPPRGSCRVTPEPRGLPYIRGPPGL